ncbi:MAG: helix-turn-helix transcriptional regulator [Clostridia bacterium]|nr:helix-turn-helix transcriptional regulator [Clostridia bacterium]
MEKKTMGSFLAALRKANGYTQQEVADKLNVSNKTVSKWECDDGCPEIMMLPAIAELYSVTVDEILKGERIQKSTNEPESQKEKKENTEKRAKYLVERVLTQYKNKSIIAITLSVIGAVLPYLGGLIFYSNYIFIPIILTIALIAASAIIMAIATNNLKSNLYTNDIVDEETLKDVKQTSIKFISLIIFFPIISLIGLITILTGYGYSAFLLLPLSLVIATAICYPSYKNRLKKENIEIVKSKKDIVRTKKFVKLTVIADIFIVVAFLFVHGCITYTETMTKTSFGFEDAINYQYETREQAENDYYKLKNAIINKEPFYIFNYVDELATDNIVVNVSDVTFDISKVENEHYFVSDYFEALDYDYTFKSKEEADKFIYENTFNESKAFYINSICSPDEYITFDDDELKVTKHATIESFWDSFFDAFIEIFIISTFFAFGATIISLIIYLKKKN